MPRSLASQLFGAALLVLLSTNSGHAAGGPARPPYAITEVEAKLFYSNTGRFSSNIFEKKGLALWNVVIGEGAGVEGPSDNTLILVRVSGPPKGYGEKLEVRFVAKTPTRSLLERKASVGVFNTAGQWYAPFMLYDTGCEPVTISVKLAGVAGAEEVSGTIPFACGE